MRPKLRPLLPPRSYVPSYAPHIAGFTVNVLRRSWPGMADIYEFDDLLQEAFITFMRCAKAFRPCSRSYQQDSKLFMALYAVALQNRLRTLAGRRLKYSCVEHVADVPDIDQSDDPEAVVEMLDLLQKLPQELAAVLQMLVGGIRCKRSVKASKKLREYIEVGGAVA